MRDHTNCRIVSTVGTNATQGSPCVGLRDCNEGFACIALNPQQCLRYCHEDADCLEGGSCMTFGDGGTFIGDVEVGVCFGG